MQLNFEQYIRNLRIFYQQLSKGHNKEEQLNKQFKTLIEKELRKWKRGYIPKQQQTQSTSDITALAKIRQNRAAKSKDKINIQTLYLSSKLQNVVVFGYLFLIFEAKNLPMFEHLEQQLKQPLTNKEIFHDKALRKLNFVWEKFEQVISGKRKIVRFEKQLEEYFKQLPQPFIDLLHSIIAKGQIIQSNNIPLYFRELTKVIEIQIDYFELNNLDVLKITNYGTEYKQSFKMGCLTHENVFIFVVKMPQKKELQINKEVTMQKFGAISEALNRMYVTTNKEYFNLKSLKNRNEIKTEKDIQGLGGLKQSSTKLHQSQFTTI